MKREELVELIITTIDDLLEVEPGDAKPELSEQSPLFGGEGMLDSMALVSAVLDIEQEINDGLDTSISLADDRAVSRKNSPFKSVGTLADYALELIDEEKGAAHG